MNYRIQPGLYAIGNPDQNSLVLATANYKLTFDTLRKELKAMNLWILVLDTKGVNVWCAAGKGTFGTIELVSQIIGNQLSKIINHKRIIVPQLGAVGVAAHQVRQLSGFQVVYGPIKAKDIGSFIDDNLKAKPEMRVVEFPASERLKLVPVEVTSGLPKLFVILIGFLVVSGFNQNGFSTASLIKEGLPAIVNLVLAFLAGTLLAPLLLPWLPGRSFAFKGIFSGLLVFILAFSFNLTGSNILLMVAWALIIPTLSSFTSMNFTGCSTFTSLSGVKKEMKTAVPIQIGLAIIGAGMWIAGQFI